MPDDNLPLVSELLARLARLAAEGQCPVFSGRDRTGVRCGATQAAPKLHDLNCLYNYLGEGLCDPEQRRVCLRERES